MKLSFKVPFLAAVGSLGKSFTSTSSTRAFTVGAIALGTVVLFGCPVYSGSAGDVHCDSEGNCCDDSSGNCTTWNCDTNDQCPSGATCAQYGICVGGGYDGGGYYYPDGGVDGGGEDGGVDGTVDCSTTGCPQGLTCTLTNGTAECLPISTPDATVDGTTPTEAGVGDAGTDAPGYPPFTGCTNDSACTDAGAGARCLDGQCVAAANECFDSTQCPVVGSSNEECVQGVCTPSCAGGAACPTGYSCDSGDGGTNVCTVNSTPCGASGETCSTGLTCVDQHCVPLCTLSADGGESCSGTGLVCVDNGCIPDQKPQFVCNTEGVQDSCHTGSICLHHSCYISCAATDAGGDAGNVCKTADDFNICKPVTGSNGNTYDVCGSNTNLGTQCNPTTGNNCASPAICIDGFCR